MIFSTSITTPANTPEASPLITFIKLSRGIIHKAELDFPSGNQFLHRVRILRYGAHLLPTNAFGYLTTDGNIIEYREHIPITDQPLGVFAHTWNLDDTFAHTVIIRLGVLSKAIITPWLLSWRERISSVAGAD